MNHANGAAIGQKTMPTMPSTRASTAPGTVRASQPRLPSRGRRRRAVGRREADRRGEAAGRREEAADRSCDASGELDGPRRGDDREGCCREGARRPRAHAAGEPVETWSGEHQQ